MISQSESSNIIPPHRRWSAGTSGGLGPGGTASSSGNHASSSLSSLAAATSTPRKEDSSHIATLAARLHKKSVLLAQERNKLREVEELLERTRPQIEEGHKTNRQVRRQELEQLMAQHRAELDFFELQDELTKERAAKDKVEEEIQAIRAENECLQAQWNRELEAVYAPHELMLQGFLQAIQKESEISTERTENLGRLQSTARRLKQSRKEMLRDRLTMLDETARLKEEANRSVSDISNLSTQVKQALVQVSSCYVSLNVLGSVLWNLKFLSLPCACSDLSCDDSAEMPRTSNVKSRTTSISGRSEKNSAADR